MSAKERQTQIVQDAINRSRLGMQIEQIHQAGDETPDTHIITVSCSCMEFLSFGFDQGKDGEWVTSTLAKIRAHVKAKHEGQNV